MQASPHTPSLSPILHGPHAATFRQGGTCRSPPMPKQRKTHSMSPEKQEIFRSLEGWATENVLPLLKPVEECWQPIDFLPDPYLPTADFNDQVRPELDRKSLGSLNFGK